MGPRYATKRRSLRRPVDTAADIRCFLLTLPLAENLRRIQRRQLARAIDERHFEQRTLAEERAALLEAGSGDLGEPFDVSAPPMDLVAALSRRLGLR